MLRHLLGLLVGLLVTPLLWLGTGWAASELGPDIASLDLADSMVLSAIAAIMTVGVLCGLLAGSRISPIAAFVPGLALLAGGVGPVVAGEAINGYLSGWLEPGDMFHPLGPALPLNLALGTLLFISALAPSRWRTNRSAGAALAPQPPQPAPGSGPAGPGGEPNRPETPPRGWQPDPELTQRRPEPDETRTAHRPDPPFTDPERTTTPFKRGPEGTEQVRWKPENDPPRTRTFGADDSS